jgi:hypothetical protein
MIKLSGLKTLKQDIKKQSLKTVNLALNAKKQTLVEDLKAATPIDTGEARDGWTVENGAIVNEVSHIVNLNQGSSLQAPALFIERTILASNGVKPNGIIVQNK